MPAGCAELHRRLTIRRSWSKASEGNDKDISLVVANFASHKVILEKGRRE